MILVQNHQQRLNGNKLVLRIEYRVSREEEEWIAGSI
jgi:hypothetical protein